MPYLRNTLINSCEGKLVSIRAEGISTSTFLKVTSTTEYGIYIVLVLRIGYTLCLGSCATRKDTELEKETHLFLETVVALYTSSTL